MKCNIPSESCNINHSSMGNMSYLSETILECKFGGTNKHHFKVEPTKDVD